MTLIAPINRFIYNLKILLTIAKTTKYWPFVVLFRLGILKNVSLKLNDGTLFELKSVSNYFSLIGYCEFKKIQRKLDIKRENGEVHFNFKEHEIIFQCATDDERNNLAPLINDQFIREEYSKLDVLNRMVVDIGTNVGDTAIYFSKSGAKGVIAIEPVKHYFDQALRNVELNHLANSISLIRAYVVSKHRISESNGHLDASPKIGIDDIVNQFDLKEAALKIDCEGCEYDIINSSNEEILHRFSSIAIEYHHGYKDIKSKLQNIGYQVNNTSPRQVKGVGEKETNLEVGLLFAHRNES